MKLGTQTVSTNGPTAFASGVPTVLPTNPNSPFAKLIVKSDVGQIVQQWLLLQNKCTLGSASSCALRCQLSGIAPYHALLVMGSRQVFIRALAPKLARNGVMVNELLLTEDQSTFEIAGHQFELIRNVKSNEAQPTNQSTSGKLRFALARPMEIGQARRPSVITTPVPMPTQASEHPQPRTAPTSELQPQWITDLIQSAMLPLERQLNDIIEPLAAVQNELDKRSKLERKRRKRLAKRAELETALATQIDVQPQIAPIPEPVMVPIISPEVQSQLAQQSETLDNLNDRLTELKSHLGSLERVVSENFVTVIDAASAPVPTPEPVSKALERITTVADQMQGLTIQLEDMKSNLGSLERIVSENLTSTNELRTAPKPTNKETLEHIALVANQLNGLTTQLDDLKGNFGSLERIASENLASTNELRAAPEAASNEGLHRLIDLTNQFNALLQEVNARQISTGEHDQVWREQLHTQIAELRDTVSATESSILKATVIRQTTLTEPCPTSAVLIDNDCLNATFQPALIQPAIQPAEVPAEIEPTVAGQFDSPDAFAPITLAQDALAPDAFAPDAFAPDAIAPDAIALSGWGEQPIVAEENEVTGEYTSVEEVAEIPMPELNIAVETELPANLFNQYAWNPEPSEGTAFGPAFEQTAAPELAASVTGWEVPELPSSSPAMEFNDTSANFIEETIEEAPMLEGAASGALPSWWTDEDRTQYRDDSSASVAIASHWDGRSNPTLDESRSIGSARESSFEVRDFGEGFVTPTKESSYQSASAWDVKVDYEHAPFSHEASAVSDVAPPPAPLRIETPTQDKAADEVLDEQPLSNDESFQLSSLLERFGIAREPDADTAMRARSDRSPIAEELPNQDLPVFVGQSEQNEAEVIDSMEAVQSSQESIATPEPDSAQPEFSAAAEGGEEESIEDYMKRLMARMRGGSVEEGSKPSSPAPVVSPPAPQQPSVEVSSPKIALPASVTERVSNCTTGPFNPEEYVPKALAQEKTRNMAAMRELANTSARSAIQVSARRRYGTAIALKLAIALTGFIVGVALVMINGLNVNIALIATVASFLVACIWGYDAFSTLKPLLYSAVETRESVAIPPEAEDVSQS